MHSSVFSVFKCVGMEGFLKAVWSISGQRQFFLELVDGIHKMTSKSYLFLPIFLKYV